MTEETEIDQAWEKYLKEIEARLQRSSVELKGVAAVLDPARGVGGRDR